MESFTNIVDDAFWAPFDPTIQEIMATQDLHDGTFTALAPEPFQLEPGATFDDLVDIDFAAYNNSLPPSSSVTPLIDSNGTTISPSVIWRASTEALQVSDPALRVPAVFPSLGGEPSVPVTPRARFPQQYHEELYPFGSPAYNEYTPTYSSQGQTVHQHNDSAQHNTQDQMASHIQFPSSSGASRKRKAPGTLDGYFKATKRSKLAVTISSTTSTSATISNTITSNTTSSITTASDERITSTMPQHAPQAAAPIGALVPTPAPGDELALVDNSFAEYAARNAEYGKHTLSRPPPNVCLPLDVELGLVELLTFFPNSGQIPLLAVRLMRNGFSYQIIAKMLLDPVNELTEKAAKTAEERIKQQFKHGGECVWPDKKTGKTEKTRWQNIAKGKGPHHDLTANHFKLRYEYAGKKLQDASWGHWKLKDIYGAIDKSKWPQGNDRMILTQCLEFARANPQLDLDTSHWDWIIQQINPQQPVFPTGFVTRDEEVLLRFSALYPTRMDMRRAREAAKKRAKRA